MIYNPNSSTIVLMIYITNMLNTKQNLKQFNIDMIKSSKNSRINFSFSFLRIKIFDKFENRFLPIFVQGRLSRCKLDPFLFLRSTKKIVKNDNKI